MRVLVLSNLYPPNALGGYELSCRDVVDQWRARGHQVLVLTTAGRVAGTTEPEQATESHVRRELGWYWHEHAFVTPSLRARLALERANAAALRRAVADLAPDVVSVWHMGGMSLSLLTALEEDGIPLVLNVCDNWPAYAPKRDAWTSLPWPVSRVAGIPTRLPRLDDHAASFVSRFTLDQVRQESAFSFPRAVVVGSGIDADDFPAISPEKPWAARVLGVGRVEPRKGFDVLVRAMADLPEASLRIVGVAEDRHAAELRELAARQGTSLSLDALPRAKLRQAYADTDVLVFPVRWDEPFGLVPLEAMSQGVPVVATRRGGAAEYLEDGVNCLAVPVDDSAAITAAVRRLGTDPALRARLVKGGHATAARYDVRALADRLEDLHRPAPVTAEPLEEATSATWGEEADVAVVISTHGRAELLGGALAGLDGQIHDRVQAVVVDNGSDDATWEVLTHWVAATSLPALALRLPFHDGPAVPRNTAVLRAGAPLLAFTDDDCLPTRPWLLQLTAPLVDPEVAVVQGRTAPEPSGWAGPWGRSLTVSGPTGLSETANLACRRGAFLAVGGFPATRVLTGRAFGEDVLLGAALARHGRTVFVDAALVHHRVLPGSFRDFLRERQRLGGFPELARRVPAVRDRRVAGLFLSSRTAAVDAGLIGLGLAVLGRRRAGLLAVPWVLQALRAGAGRPGRPRVLRAAQVAAGDVIGAAALVKGSARSGRWVL